MDMKKIRDLELGFADAENYKRRENKELLNRIFIRDHLLDRLCMPSISLLVGEKGTGKTAYSVYLANNNYQNSRASIRFLRQTEYLKFIALKAQHHLELSDFSSIWKVILMLLLSHDIREREGNDFLARVTNRFDAINEAIDEYYQNAFSPEIIQAIKFAEENSISAGLISKYLQLKGEEAESLSFSESRFQANLFYIQQRFEKGLAQLKLKQQHILFIDGIDIRPTSIPYPQYLDCIKGLAHAAWELNNDFFPSIKGSKGRMRVVLLIRPDIFESLGLQNQNTKIRDNAVFLDWRTRYTDYRASNLFKVTDHLLGSQQECALPAGMAWNYYFPWDSPNLDRKYEAPSSFISFMRWSYYRPRDIVMMLRILKDVVVKLDPERQQFTLSDFNNFEFQSLYSNYLLGEVKDHLSFYYGLGDYNLFLKFFEFLDGKNKFTYETFLQAFQQLQDHIKSISSSCPQFMATANDFLQFLYDLNVICYTERAEDDQIFIRWCFRERDYSNISPKIKIGAEYQVFYGLAKALNVGKALRGSQSGRGHRPKYIDS